MGSSSDRTSKKQDQPNADRNGQDTRTSTCRGMIPLGICVRLFQACITRCNANKSGASDNTLASSEQRFGLHPAGDGCSPNIGDESWYGSKLHRFRTQFVGPAEDMFFSDSFVIFTLRPSACTHLDLGKSSTWEPKVYQPNIVLCSTTIHFPLNVFFGTVGDMFTNSEALLATAASHTEVQHDVVFRNGAKCAMTCHLKKVW